MQPVNQVIRSQEDLLNHFQSSRKLEILDSEQMKILLALNVQPEVWENASNINLLSFSQEFVQKTKEFKFQRRGMQYCYILSFLTNLTDINLFYNNVSDISSISKLKNLKKLDLSINFIDDISALQSLTDLTHLYLQQNKLTSYTVALPNLVHLSLNGNPLQDKSGLQHSPKLETLRVYETETIDLRTISQLFGLKVLDLSYNNITQISQLSNFQLERLYLSKTETTDLRTIPHQLFGLKELCLSSNNITEISHLSNFIDLKILDLDCNKQLQNIGPLKFCTKITELSISATSIADIWPLQFMKKSNNIEHKLYKSC
ncbi:leucine-rich_repeat domain-containing protein [Hexamita inflata]|uniref:Partial n=1 Tax=Hexamita inflata TaxID=28002 RepID=A0AA86QK02_9EUKA|nr:leucine-rich repeat domain-containing protein [Hexamita inflata]